ncbi:MAG: sigma-54 dependent transcriptional regulator [Planctomycetota bacterium]|nr:sigma-54 dependent transcriptional regulator [Planctomycetota bacterium]MDA0934227.1 sigma-54 dependent transcriptional regulator [Planctomycetota bacterium]
MSEREDTAATARILIVDDERDLADSCAFFVERSGHSATVVASAEDALERLRQERFDLLVSDIRMPRMSGLSLLEAVRTADPDLEVILMTGFPEVEAAVRAIKLGAFDYIQKPFDECQLMERVEKALAHRGLRARNVGFRERVDGLTGPLVYRAPTFARTVELIERAARTDASVLIQGESGTGKELLAHHLHDSSGRAARPFVPVDCTTMPESLIESELFGHVKGAFSGAAGAKMGLFQLADGGTLFLDEIGELPLAFQAKFLRAIQERQIRRVGGTETIQVDVRIVCATNRNLAHEVDAGRFRQDLFYRLDVVRIDVPPLRDRREDVELLSQHFLDAFRRANPSCAVHAIDAGARAALRAHTWPGNVRQLRNAIQRACALGSGAMIRAEDLPSEIFDGVREVVAPATDGTASTFQEMKARKVAAIESSYVQELLRRNDGNVTRSAEEAGMSRSALQKLMQRYGIKSGDFRLHGPG